MNLTVLLTLTLTGFLSLPTPSQQAPSKPIRVAHIGTYFRTPPDSLTETITTADVVVHGRVIGSLPRDIRGSGGDIRPGTLFRVKVLEVLHAYGGRPVPTDEITTVREGGDRDRGTYIERTIQDGFPHLQIGHEYVLFLKWNSVLNDWAPAFGPDGTWDLTAGRMESAGSAKVTQENRGRARSEVLDRIRRFGGL